MKVCSVGGCDRKFYARGWCHLHYKRWHRTGEARPEVPERSALKAEYRFWSNVTRTDGCWLWTGLQGRGGYGYIRAGRMRLVHRFAYELLVGPIPDGLHLDHLCRVRNCVNPDHLEPVTNAENVRRGISPPAVNAAKTHCIRGHEFTPENTYLRKGARCCRTCGNARNRSMRKKRQTAADR